MFTLFLDQGFPFDNNPRNVELPGDKILTNNVILPRNIDAVNAYNPHNVRLWVIGHEFGALCAVWARNEQDSFDKACNAGMLDCLMSEEQDYDDESLAALGDASELFDLSHTWIAPVEWQAERDIKLILAMVRAVENQESTLENQL